MSTKVSGPPKDWGTLALRLGLSPARRVLSAKRKAKATGTNHGHREPRDASIENRQQCDETEGRSFRDLESAPTHAREPHALPDQESCRNAEEASHNEHGGIEAGTAFDTADDIQRGQPRDLLEYCKEEKRDLDRGDEPDCWLPPARVPWPCSMCAATHSPNLTRYGPLAVGSSHTSTVGVQGEASRRRLRLDGVGQTVPSTSWDGRCS